MIRGLSSFEVSARYQRDLAAYEDKGEEKILRWIDGQDEDDLFLSVATLMEIRVDIEQCAVEKKRQELEHWLVHDLNDRFEERIVPVERHTADLAGRIIVRSTTEGWKMESMDALIGAPAMVNDMALATLNRKHFEKLGVALVELIRAAT